MCNVFVLKCFSPVLTRLRYENQSYFCQPVASCSFWSWLWMSRRDVYSQGEQRSAIKSTGPRGSSRVFPVNCSGSSRCHLLNTGKTTIISKLLSRYKLQFTGHGRRESVIRHTTVSGLINSCVSSLLRLNYVTRLQFSKFSVPRLLERELRLFQ